MLSINEKSQIQALDRTQPLLPMKPHQVERRTHDYKRHGTTTLFAALDVETGEVTGTCSDTHRTDDIMPFLKLVARTYPREELHLILDHASTHTNTSGSSSGSKVIPASISTSPPPGPVG